MNPNNELKPVGDTNTDSSSIKQFTSRFGGTLGRAIKHFSVFEKTLFWILFGIMFLSASSLFFKVNNLFTVDVPISGGELNEGIIGSARFINPVIAISDPDRDLTSVIYSGLTRTLSSGEVVPDLAEKYEVSDDGKTYTFYLRSNAKFHDGTKVTTDDIEFTIQKIEDPLIKSPKRANWFGVTVEKINESTISFHLKQAYAPFIYNTSVGILPKHLWKDLSTEEFPLSLYNFEPIGSGPYKVSSIAHTNSGLPASYTLEPFSNFELGKAYLNKIIISFYPNEDSLYSALEKGDIESIHSVGADELDKIKSNGNMVETSTLPRIFGVFFNQNQAPIFLDSAVRKALDTSLNKQKVVDDVLGGYGTVINGPLPEEFGEYSTDSRSDEERISEAKKILENSGWKYNEGEHVLEKIIKKGKTSERQVLAFSLETADAPELKKTAESLKKTWETLGARVDIKIFESGDLNQNIIRPRKYDALLFGEVIGRDLDLYAFWHSSQRNDPGLNIAMYANSKTDKILEDARSMGDANSRIKNYKDFAEIINSDTPAVFLYSPQFIYILPKKIKGVLLNNITVPSDRFSEVYKWYTDSEKVWKLLAK